MHTDEPRELQGVELGYDPRDIDAPKIYKVVIGFFAFAVFFFGLGAIVYIYWGKFGFSSNFDPRKPAIVGPKVQGNVAAKIDIMSLRQAERRQMEGYGQNQDGKQHIPVDAAMEILAKRGLPTISNDEKAVSPGNTIPQNAVGPAGPSTNTSPANPGAVPTPPTGSAGTLGP